MDDLLLNIGLIFIGAWVALLPILLFRLIRLTIKFFKWRINNPKRDSYYYPIDMGCNEDKWNSSFCGFGLNLFDVLMITYLGVYLFCYFAFFVGKLVIHLA